VKSEPDQSLAAAEASPAAWRPTIAGLIATTGAVMAAGMLRLNPIPALSEEFNGYSQLDFQQDLLAGLTVGIVALPLALAFGVTSGAGAAAGLFTAIIAGIIASIFGGSRFQITGPTGAMTVVLIPVIAHYGVEKIAVVGLMAGFILLILGILRVGRWIQLIPWPVITGFTNGIAAIIFLQQIPAALGINASKGENGIVPATIESIGQYLLQPNVAAPVLALATIAILWFWTRVKTRIPGSIVALLIITIISVILALSVPRIGSIPNSLPLPHWPRIQWRDLSDLWGVALAVALLAGIESLLSAVVADGMSNRKRHDSDRELIGQGLANIIVPFFGGIPATGAIARTAVSVRSGGQTRLTGVIHALFLLLVVLLLGRFAAVIPKAVLAGILMFTASRMIEWEAVRALLRSNKSDLLTMLVTTFVTIAFDLVLAIEVGLAVAGFLFIRRMAKSLVLAPFDPADEVPAHLNHDQVLLRQRVVAYRIEGPLFFAVAGEFLEQVLATAEVDVLILRMHQVAVLDASAANALKTIKETLDRRKIKMLIVQLQPQPQKLLENMGLLVDVSTEGHHLFESTAAAIEHAWSHVLRNPANWSSIKEDDG
jgi:sulfate permease, SulP family